MEAPRIFIGIPCHDNRWHYQFGMSLVKLAAAQRFSINFENLAGGGIHKARNNIAATFLKSGLKKLLFTDTDVSFAPENVQRLYSLDLPIVSGLYCHKKPPGPDGPAWIKRPKQDVEVDMATGLHVVHAVPTGFLMIDRDVFTTIAAKFPEISYVEDWNDAPGDVRYDFFPEGPILDPERGYPERTFGTEDFGFCHLAARAGFDCVLDTTFYVRHWEGQRGYPEAPPEKVQLESKEKAA